MHQGGLTTPTCNEAVLWTNFMSMQTISEAQLAIFRTMTDSDSVSIVDNYRPPQPLNARTLYTTGVSTRRDHMEKSTIQYIYMQYRISDELIGWLYEMLVIRHAFLAFETGGAHPCSPRRAEEGRGERESGLK